MKTAVKWMCVCVCVCVGGFAIGAWVSLLWQHSTVHNGAHESLAANVICQQVVHACTHSCLVTSLSSSCITVTGMPPVDAALVVTYLQFPIQVCFPCSASPSPTRFSHHHRYIPQLISVFTVVLIRPISPLADGY